MDFIPSTTYVGSRDGYYFRNGPNGTGYYHDDTQKQQQLSKTIKASSMGSNNTRRKVGGNAVRINEEQNTIHPLPINNDNDADDDDYILIKSVAKRRRVQQERQNRQQLLSENTHNSHSNENQNDNSNSSAAIGRKLLEEAEKKLKLVSEDSTSSLSSSISTLDLTNKKIVQITIKNLQKVVTTNETLREQYSDDNNSTVAITSAADAAYHYMDSEIILYECITSCKSFIVNPIKYFLQSTDFQAELVSNLLLPLLLHPNSDIVESIVSLFIEWFDPTILLDISEDDNDNENDSQDDVNDVDDTKTTSKMSLVEKSQLTCKALLHTIQTVVVGGGIDMIVQTLYTNNNTMNSIHNTNTNVNSDTSTTTIDNNDQVGNGWKDVITLIENVIEIESIVSQQYPEIVQSILYNNERNSTKKKNGSTAAASSSSNSTQVQLSLAAHLVQETSILQWLFEQLDAFQTNQSTTTSSSSKDKSDQMLIDSIDDNEDAVIVRQQKQEKLIQHKLLQQEKADRSLELLVVISSKESVYEVVPNWSTIPISKEQQSTLIPDDDIQNNIQSTKNRTIDGLEILLIKVSYYKKRQPIDDIELERIENTCLIVSSLLLYSSQNLINFVQVLQGIELIIRCCKEQIHCGGLVYKWLDFSTSDEHTNQLAYNHFISIGGLKYIFTFLMNKRIPKQYSDTKHTIVGTSTDNETKINKLLKKQKKNEKEWISMIERTTIRILYGLIRYINDTSPYDAKERLVAKFVDGISVDTNPTHNTKNAKNNSNTTTKIDRLIDLLLFYERKVRIAEYNFYRSDIEDMIMDSVNDNDNNLDASSKNDKREQFIQLAVIDAKLQAGGDLYHRIAAIIGYCCINSSQCHAYVVTTLQQQQQSQNHQISIRKTSTGSNNNSTNSDGGGHGGITLLIDALTEFDSLLPDDSIQKQQIQSYLQLL